MANVLSSAGATFEGMIGGSVGNILWIVVIFLFLIIFFAGLWFLMWWKSFSYTVKIYEPTGMVNLTPEEAQYLNKLDEKEMEKVLANRNIKFDRLKYKKTHGKFISVKGSQYFQTIMPLLKHEPIPAEMMYDDGIHLLKLSKSVFLPIPRPKTIVNVGEHVSISIADNNRWLVWNNMMAERVNAKYQDLDAQKKVAMYFVVGIVATVLVGGFIIWMIYLSTKQGYKVADKFSAVVNQLTAGSKPI